MAQPQRDGATQFHTLVQDANKNVKETYRDVRELITAVKEHNNKTTFWTGRIAIPGS